MRRLRLALVAGADGRPEGADALAQTEGAKPTVAQGHVDEVWRNDGMRAPLLRLGEHSFRCLDWNVHCLVDRLRPLAIADEIDRTAVAQPVAGDGAADGAGCRGELTRR